jgi:hypothetical protein
MPRRKPSQEEQRAPVDTPPTDPSLPMRKLTRPKRLRARPRELTIQQLLQWADDYQARTGRWPTRTSGPVTLTLVETWSTIDQALQHGRRASRVGLSLYQILLKVGLCQRLPGQ